MTTLTIAIADAAGDKYGSATNVSDNLYWGGAGAGASFHAGMRFLNVTIPAGATINSAHVHGRAIWNPGVFPVNAHITCEDADNPGAWAATTHTPKACTKTTAYAQYDLAAMTSGTWYQTSDFKDAVQEVVDRDGWASGNALCVVISDDGSASNAYCGFADYATNPTYAAYIDIDYTEADTTVEVTTTASSSELTVVEAALLRTRSLTTQAVSFEMTASDAALSETHLVEVTTTASFGELVSADVIVLRGRSPPLVAASFALTASAAALSEVAGATLHTLAASGELSAEDVTSRFAYVLDGRSLSGELTASAAAVSVAEYVYLTTTASSVEMTTSAVDLDQVTHAVAASGELTAPPVALSKSTSGVPSTEYLGTLPSSGVLVAANAALAESPLESLTTVASGGELTVSPAGMLRSNPGWPAAESLFTYAASGALTALAAQLIHSGSLTTTASSGVLTASPAQLIHAGSLTTVPASGALTAANVVLSLDTLATLPASAELTAVEVGTRYAYAITNRSASGVLTASAAELTETPWSAGDLFTTLSAGELDAEQVAARHLYTIKSRTLSGELTASNAALGKDDGETTLVYAPLILGALTASPAALGRNTAATEYLGTTASTGVLTCGNLLLTKEGDLHTLAASIELTASDARFIGAFPITVLSASGELTASPAYLYAADARPLLTLKSAGVLSANAARLKRKARGKTHHGTRSTLGSTSDATARVKRTPLGSTTRD